jgi:membrane associated rhomboid family serine protease
MVMALSFSVVELFGLSQMVFGVLPRNALGLAGILFAPLIHADVEHLVSNLLPLLVTGVLMHWFYRPLIYRVYFFGWLSTGFIVWLVARSSNHIGASGLLYAITVFLFVSGVLRANYRLIAVSLIVVFLYGSMIWGIFPLQAGISWESHAAGSLVGLVMAYYYRAYVTPVEKLEHIKPQPDDVELLEERFGERYWDPNRSDGESSRIIYFYKHKDEEKI